MNHASGTVQGAELLDGAVQAAGGRCVGRRLRAGDAGAVGAALYALPACDLHVPALPVARLSVLLTPSRLCGGLDDEPPRCHASSRYAAFLMPAGTAAHWRLDAPSRHLTLFFDARALAGSAEPMCDAAIPGIRPLVDELVVELETGPAWSAEAADGLGRLLLVRLARHRARRPVAANPLTPQHLARLADYVQAHLAERMRVSDLAEVVGLAPQRFAHAYAALTGQPPHQYVLALRLRRAQALLQDDDMPLAEVAAACGFASQQHLTQVMRKRLDVTPARYRREQGGQPPLPGGAAWRTALPLRSASSNA